METLVYMAGLFLAYLLGSIPTGYVVGRLRGLDIRQHGSGNIGAANTFRILGKTAGVFVFLADALKGYLACQCVIPVVRFGLGNTGLNDPASRERFMILLGLAAILGHLYPCWLKFKGGKGIATTAGVFLALTWPALLSSFGVWMLVFALGRYVSLASIISAIFLPIIVWYWDGSLVLISLTLVVSALALYKHKANMRRLIQGTEHRFGKKRDNPEKETT